MNRGALGVGALLALTLGWPLIGAVNALAWPGVLHDSIGPDIKAALVLVRDRGAALDAVKPAAPDITTQEPTCLDKLLARSARPSVEDWDDRDIAAALDHLRRLQDHGHVEEVAARNLRDLPRPVLGGLAGCVTGSLLRPLCRAYLDTRLRSAFHAARLRLDRTFISHDVQAQRLACYVLTATAQSRG